MEYTVDKASGFIFVGRSYNASGRSMLAWKMDEVDLSPQFPDSVFDVVPSDMKKVYVADNQKEWLEYDLKITKTFIDLLVEYRERRENGGMLPWHRRLWGQVKRNGDSLIRIGQTLALALAAICIPLAIWLKIRKKHEK